MGSDFVVRRSHLGGKRISIGVRERRRVPKGWVWGRSDFLHLSERAAQHYADQVPALSGS